MARQKADEKLKNTTRNAGKKRAATGTRAASKKSKSNKANSGSMEIEQTLASLESGQIAQASTSKETDQTKEKTTEDEDVICCECNISYEDDVRSGCGEEWVQCACSRWIHANCIDEVIIDADGNERICSFCVV